MKVENENKNSKLKILTSSTLAATILSSSFIPSFANAAEDKAKEGNKDENDKKEETKNGSQINIDVDHSKVDSAVKEAKDAGVQVTKGEDKTKTVSVSEVPKAKKDIEAEDQKQITSIQEAVKKQKAQDDKYNKELADYNSKKSASDDAKKKYEADMKKYEADMKKYEAEKKKFDDAKKTADEKNSGLINAYKQKVQQEKAVVDKAKANPLQPKYDSKESKGYTASGSWTNLRAKTIDSVHLASTGQVNSFADLQNGKFAIHAYSDKDKVLSNDRIIQNIKWDNVAPKGKGIVKGDKINEDLHKKVPGYNLPAYDTSGEKNPKGKTTQLWSVKPGTWVTIPKAIKLADGTTKDVQVKFTKSGTNMKYGDEWVTFWNEGGAINYYDGANDAADTPPKNKITATYRVADDSDGKNKYLWTGATFDIDAGQKLTMGGDNSVILGVGGGLKADGDKITNIKSDDNLGKTWGKQHNEKVNFLNGTTSTPDGVVVFAAYGNEISHGVENTGVKNSTLVANADFGLKVNTRIAEYPKLDPGPNSSDEPTPPKKPEPPKGEQLTPPKKPDPIKVNYNVTNLLANPSNKKDVEKGVQKQDTKESINEKEVKAGDIITYPLTNSALPADRKDDIKSYVITDEVPKGVTIDQKTTKQLADKNWDVKVEGQKITFTATKTLLDAMNKDKKQEFKVPDVALVGEINTSGVDLTNEFTTTINGGDVKSNQVKNTTPKIVKSSLKKDVSTDQIINFNQGYQYRLDFTFANDKNYKEVFIGDDAQAKPIDFTGAKVYDTETKKDITEQGKLEFDDEKETIKWTPKNTKDFLGKSVYMMIDAKVKPGEDMSKYKVNKDRVTEKDQQAEDQASEKDQQVKDQNKDVKEENTIAKPTTNAEEQPKKEAKDESKSGKEALTDEKDNSKEEAASEEKADDAKQGEQIKEEKADEAKSEETSNDTVPNQKVPEGSTVYSLPNTGYMGHLAPGQDKPEIKKTNEVPIKVMETPSKIKKYIIEDGKLVEKNEAKKGDQIDYLLEATAGNNNKGKTFNISDDLIQQLDLKGKDIKVYEAAEENGANEKLKNKFSESNSSESDEKVENKAESKQDEQPAAKEDQSKAEDKEQHKQGETDKKAEAEDKEQPAAKEDKADKKAEDQSKAENKEQPAAKEDKAVSEEEQPKDFNKPDAKPTANAAEESVVKEGKIEQPEDAKADENKDKSKAENKDQKEDNKEEVKDGQDKADDQEKDQKADEEQAKDESKGETSDNKADDIKELKGAKDITNQGKLEVDDEKESFKWTPNDASKFKGKKIYVKVSADIKKDADFSEVTNKDNIIQLDNVAMLDVEGEKNGPIKSNKVSTIIKPIKKEQPAPPKPEEPKKPEPQKEQPKEQPQKEQPAPKEEPKKESPLPSTGSKTADVLLYSGVIGLLTAAAYRIYRKYKGSNE